MTDLSRFGIISGSADWFYAHDVAYQQKAIDVSCAELRALLHYLRHRMVTRGAEAWNDLSNEQRVTYVKALYHVQKDGGKLLAQPRAPMVPTKG